MKIFFGALLCLLWSLASADNVASVPRLPLFQSESQLRLACEEMLEIRRQSFDRLANLPLSQASQKTVLDAWDDMLVHFQDVLGPINILAQMSPAPGMREAAGACLVEADQLRAGQYQDARIYERIRTAVPQHWAAIKLRQDLLESFQESGVTLTPDRRSQLRVIKDAITRLDQDFEANLRDNSETISFSPAEQRGLPEDYVKRLGRDEAGNIRAGLTQQDYRPFMANADNAEARRRFYQAYLRRGGPRNMQILREINGLRARLAEFHGHENYAVFALSQRMLNERERVEGFLASMADVVHEQAAKELHQLRKSKAEHLGTRLEQTGIRPWDLDYYLTRLRESRFAINQESLRRYFPLPETLQWLFAMVEELYGIEVVEEPADAWHEDVRYFTVVDKAGGLLGGFYTDLYPREGKYPGAAAFDVRKASTRRGRRAISVLVANFDRDGLTHEELQTLLHEFGHVLHALFAQTHYSAHGGVGVERDFVEAPSQMFEEWARRPETLRRLSRNCEQCPHMSDELITRLDAARRFGSGLHYARQLLYARYDMALASGEAHKPLSLWEEMEAGWPLGHVEGTEFPGTFGHITGGYAAAYYGYLWSQAVALDLLSTFGDRLMNPARAQEYREQVLARGDEYPAAILLENYLGRAPETAAFFAEIRGGRAQTGMSAQAE